MPFQMVYQSRDGVDHPSSYWEVTSILINPSTKNASVQFIGYKDVAARAADKSSIGNKSYNVTLDSTYDLYFAPPNVPVTSCYILAMTTKDTGGLSFFEQAIIV